MSARDRSQRGFSSPENFAAACCCGLNAGLLSSLIYISCASCLVLFEGHRQLPKPCRLNSSSYLSRGDSRCPAPPWAGDFRQMLSLTPVVCFRTDRLSLSPVFLPTTFSAAVSHSHVRAHSLTLRPSLRTTPCLHPTRCGLGCL